MHRPLHFVFWLLNACDRIGRKRTNRGKCNHPLNFFPRSKLPAKQIGKIFLSFITIARYSLPIIFFLHKQSEDKTEQRIIKENMYFIFPAILFFSHLIFNQFYMTEVEYY